VRRIHDPREQANLRGLTNEPASKISLDHAGCLMSREYSRR